MNAPRELASDGSAEPNWTRVRNAAALVALLGVAVPLAYLATLLLAYYLPWGGAEPYFPLYSRIGPHGFGGAETLLGGAIASLYLRDTARAVGASVAGAGLAYVAVVLAYAGVGGLIDDRSGVVEEITRLAQWEELFPLLLSGAGTLLVAAVAAAGTSVLVGTIGVGRPAATVEPSEQTGDRSHRGPHESRSIDPATEDSE